jgi:Crp-like helix-turn-helix domain
LSGGEVIEAAMIGRDGILGATAALDGLISLSKAIVQLGGNGETLDVARLREVADRSRDFRTTLIRHEQVLFAQAQQSAACIAAHTVEARLSRWLLRSRDLSGGDTLLLTQEFLAQMLGRDRSSVSPAAHTLQKAGLIRYKRGHIEILNLEGLEDAACECYGTVKAQYDRLLNNHS